MSIEARQIVVDALQKAMGTFDNSGLSTRLNDPAGDVALSELGLDSLTGIEWCMEIETATGLELDPAVLGRLDTLSAFVDHVAGRLEAA
ncbi:acyl carrier protein [Prosthecodimorpha staleyi]|uniref:Acyl carrier protein n=1 Tax=Prosthecodimorpha staleyi TaxID=2840188 RepID=A0A947D1G4_9HYPH|nr:acyl carrier protein [Prosthecodimorpha staleyi]MBT9289198.1 acyl carrier protein [Prosthecodimorpha staleyi]